MNKGRRERITKGRRRKSKGKEGIDKVRGRRKK